jgi:hypothetical protein
MSLRCIRVNLIIGTTMDRGVNRSSGKDGARMIVVPWWNANFDYVLPRQASVHNLYYSALYFYACALSFKELNYPDLMSLTSITGSCSLLCYRIIVEVE